jgi:hypothetical protein
MHVQTEGDMYSGGGGGHMPFQTPQASGGAQLLESGSSYKSRQEQPIFQLLKAFKL